MDDLTRVAKLKPPPPRPLLGEVTLALALALALTPDPNPNPNPNPNLAGKRARLAPERYDAAPAPPPSTALTLISTTSTTSTRPAEATPATGHATPAPGSYGVSSLTAAPERSARRDLLPPGWTIEEHRSSTVYSNVRLQKLRTWN